MCMTRSCRYCVDCGATGILLRSRWMNAGEPGSGECGRATHWIPQLRGRCRSCPTSLSLGSIRIPIWGMLARALIPLYAVGGWSCTPSGLRAWAECARTQLIRSVPPAAALCNFAPACWREGGMSQLAAGPKRGVYVCPVDPQHGHDPRCGCTSKSRSRSVGHPAGRWRQLVDTWSALLSAASSGQASRSLTLEEWCRFSCLTGLSLALGMERPVVCRAGATDGTHAPLCLRPSSSSANPTEP
jgi:hypothetical protein